MTYKAPKSKSWLYIIICLMIVALVYLYNVFLPVYQKTRVPVLEQAWVVSMVDGEAVAGTDPKFVTEGQDIMLYAVAAGKLKGEDERCYFTNAPALMIDGEKIPEEQVMQWDTAWGDIRVLWFKVEPRAKSYEDITSLQEITYKETFCSDWKSTWQHSVDVTPNQFPYHVDNVGVMRYKVKFALYWEDDAVTPYRKVDSPGIETITGAGIGDAVHRVAIAGSNPDTGVYRAFFNVPYLREPWEAPSIEHHPAERFIASGGHDLVIAAHRLAGDSALAYTPAGDLQKYAKLLYKNLLLYADRSYREKSRTGSRIPFGKNGVRPGDILMQGEAVGILLRDEGGMRVGAGVLSDDDRIITNYKNFPGESQVGDIFDDGFAVLRWTGSE